METVFKTYLLLVLVAILSTWWVAQAKDKKAEADADDDDAGESQDDEVPIGTVIGIDLGTTYSCVGVYKRGQVDIIANDQGNRITPSYVAFTAEGDRLIGDAAKNQLTSNPENTVFDVKRFIGRNWIEKSVQHDIKFYPFKIIEKEGKPHVQVQTSEGAKIFAPEEISAMVLGKMKEIAEAYLGKRVDHAVVTVPAYFNDAQRQATKNAGTISGLNVLRIINEPTAAAIAYGLDQKEGERNVLVFDLGGGTFDVSLLTIENGVFEVVATNGDTHLGGEDFDQRVMEYFMKMYKKRTGKDIKKDNRAVQKLRREVEKAKRALSISHKVRLDIESFLDGEDFSETLTRAKFEELNNDLFRSTLVPLQIVLDDAGITIDKVDELVLVGGSTRIPKIQELVKEFCNGKEPNRNINPDEAVAFGAAVQAGVLSGEEVMDDMVLLDVNPLSLGIETQGGVMSTVIPRNTVIPTKKTHTFSTSVDNQEKVVIQVYEGERAVTKENHLLGAFHLTGLPPLPRGVPVIEVTFEIDVNGILKVTAEDTGTGVKSQIVIKNDQKSLTPEDIERMVREAEKYSEDDKKIKERLEARAELEKEVYQMRYQLTLGQLREKVTEAEKEAMLAIVNEIIANLENNMEADVDQLKLWKKTYENEIHPITQQMYKRQQKQEKEEEEDDDDDDDDDERDEL